MPRSRRSTPVGVHAWMDDACLRCGIRRREEWLLDESGHAVMAIVWAGRQGDLRIQPFPPMRGVEPTAAPLRTLAEAFPGLAVGREPACRR